MASADDTIAKLAAQAAGMQRATSASSQLEEAIKAEQAALAGLGGSLDDARAKMAAMQAAASVNIAAYERQAAAIRQLEAAHRAAAASADKLASARGPIAAAEAARKLADENKRLADSARDNAQATDVSGASLSGAVNALKAAGPEGYAVAIAMTVLTGAAIGLGAALTAMGIAAYSVIDQREDWITLFDALGKGPAAGEKTLAMVDALAKELPFSTAKIAEWSKSLLAAGVSEKDLADSVKAVAAATALMGEQGGAAAETLIKRLAEGGEAAKSTIKGIQDGSPKAAAKLAEMGLHVEDLAAALKMTPEAFKKATLSAEQMRKAIEAALQKKGAGALENMFGDMPVILMKVREGFLSIFEKLGKPMGAFMAAVGKMFSQFNKGTPTIKALQAVATTVFTAILGAATRFINFIRPGLLQIVPAITAVAKFFAPVIAIFKGGGGAIAAIFKQVVGHIQPLIAMLKAVFSNAQVLKGIQTIFKVIAVVIVAVIIIVATLIARFVMAAASIIAAVGLIIGGIANFAGQVSGFVGGIIDALSGLAAGASDAASGFIDGLLGGISAGAGAIMAAVSGLAAGALGAFKSALGIASPSKVMMQMGGHMAAGVAEGVDDGAPKAQAAMAAMVDPKSLRVGKGGGGANRSVTFRDCSFGSVSETQIREWTLRALEEDGFGGPEAAPA